MLLNNQNSTRNFYVGSNPPRWLHTWVPNGGRLLTHMGMLLLAGRVEEGGDTPYQCVQYSALNSRGM